MKFLKIVVFAVGTYYILRFIIRVYNAHKKLKQQSQQPPVKKDITVDYSPKKKPGRYGNNDGDFIEYEEVKD